MSRPARENVWPAAPLEEIVFELGLLIGRDVKANNDFEELIARAEKNAPGADMASVRASLTYCRDATTRLSDLYYLVRFLARHEPALRELVERLQATERDGAAAAA